ncbi:hypothetical protein GGX14DRAFT_391909 [Mycena pura]|uniref:Uncharacterized protein n=1 Tax=Mycena pura TaxID=153505 RepID=A0AAD6VK54_9AGAR|nr:hypothetical protein GGX14DRAFT_391909 [Mycena pura]
MFRDVAIFVIENGLVIDLHVGGHSWERVRDTGVAEDVAPVYRLLAVNSGGIKSRALYQYRISRTASSRSRSNNQMIIRHDGSAKGMKRVNRFMEPTVREQCILGISVRVARNGWSRDDTGLWPGTGIVAAGIVRGIETLELLDPWD